MLSNLEIIVKTGFIEFDWIIRWYRPLIELQYYFPSGKILSVTEVSNRKILSVIEISFNKLFE